MKIPLLLDAEIAELPLVRLPYATRCIVPLDELSTAESWHSAAFLLRRDMAGAVSRQSLLALEDSSERIMSLVSLRFLLTNICQPHYA
jgi:hypothetical protein